MQEIPADVTTADVWQWLNHGWFWYDDGEVRVPATVEDNETELRVYPLGLDSVEFNRATCFPHWPECGALNMNGYAVYLHRNPARQYRRTYNSRCLRLEVPSKWHTMGTYPEVKGLSPDHSSVVEAAFTPLYYTYTKALELLAGRWVSVALNRHLIVAGTAEEHAVYYRAKLLAQVQKGTLTPLTSNNPRNLRILKWFDERVNYAHSS